MVKLYEEVIGNPVIGQSQKEKGLSRKTINIIRTTQRNNIDLTALADNKANVMLSLNAIIIAAIVPMIIANLDRVVGAYLYIPLIILVITSFVSMYISAQVLKPSNFDKMKNEMNSDNTNPSPFFFGNFYQMEAEDYFEYIKESLSEPELIQSHLAQDLYYVGRRLGEKMSLVRRAYNIFIVGIFLTIVSTAVVLLLF